MASVRFILGRAGTGKTRHLVGQIADLCRADPLGPPVYWLVPKQATFQAERLLTITLGGFARVRVVDFAKLGQAVLDSCGDVGMPEVTPAGRRMVIGHLLRSLRPRLKYYDQSAHRPGLAAELDNTFAELERAGLDPDSLDALVHTMDGNDADDPLRAKLADVHLLLAHYHAHLGTDRLDPARRLDRVLARVAGCPALAGATLFVDDFYDFTAAERRLLTAVAAVAGRTEIALLLDPDDPAVADFSVTPSDLSVFHRTVRTYRGLRKALRDAAVPVEPAVALRAVYRGPSLAAVERGLFTPAVPPGAAVEFFHAPDARAEVDAVARQIRAAVTTGGLRLRDVAVLVRSMPDYQEIVHASFGEHGLRYFADRRRPADHHPLLRMVRSCLRVGLHNWPPDDVMTLAKCGLTGLADDDADRLENYTLRHRLRGRAAWESATPWAFRPELRRDEDGPAVSSQSPDDLRQRLLRPLAPLLAVMRSGKVKVRDLAAAVFGVLTAYGVPVTLAKWMADADAAHDPERRGEHEQVWAELIALFDQMVDVIGDETVTAGEFLDVLDSGLDGLDLAIAPPTVDEVLLGQVDRTRTPAVKLAFVLGMAEGKFPLVRREELVLSDADRRSLRARQIDLDEDAERQLLDERFLAYVAFTRPTDRLVVSRPLGDAKGRAANPSVYWRELQRLVPAAAPDLIPRSSAADPRTIGTPRQLVDALMRWVRAGSPTGDGVLPALYQWLAVTPPDGSAVDVMRFRAWRALSYDNAAKLDPDHAAALFHSPLTATVRQLEDAAACPFRHFAKYGLRLAEREVADVTRVDLHNAYHEVIEKLTADLMAQKADWCGLSPAATRDLIRHHVADVGQQLREKVMLSTARNRYLLDHIERTLERAVASMAEFNRRGKYRPRWAGLRFGPNQPLSHDLTTPAGRTVHLHGRIDRVDLNDRGTAFIVADYKLTPASLTLDRVYHGLSLQLLTYLLVVRAGGPALVGHKLAPAAAFLLGVLRSPQSVDSPDDAVPPDDADFHLRHKPRGLIEARALPSLDGGHTDGGSKVVAAFRKKDGTLGNKHNTDVAEQAEFDALLKLVDRKLGEAADRVVDGGVDVRPFMLGRETPCPRCAYRTVCRFEPDVNRYRILPKLPREDVLRKAVEASADVAELVVSE